MRRLELPGASAASAGVREGVEGEAVRLQAGLGLGVGVGVGLGVGVGAGVGVEVGVGLGLGGGVRGGCGHLPSSPKKSAMSCGA